MHYILLFLEGVLTFISPCLLPLLPVYVSFFIAGKPDKRRALINSLGFVAGFTFVFVLLGALAGTIGRLLNEYALLVNITTGTVVIVLGLNFLGVLNIRFLNQTRHQTTQTRDLRFFSSLLFGIVFSIGWTPCVGALLGSALMMASNQGTALSGILMLLVYSLGLGIPFVVSAILIDRLKNVFDFIKRNYQIITMISGILLIIIGILMATGLMGRFLLLFS
ncbi:MAG: cytochrome c biogenesis protein CcdA [Peptococcaceae bacterium]|nr:cytochrome c biogenesis protein CcdA [Peptococcaceae bacterium]